MGNCVLSVGWDDESDQTRLRYVHIIESITDRYRLTPVTLRSPMFSSGSKCGVEIGGLSLLFRSRQHVCNQMEDCGREVKKALSDAGAKSVWFHVHYDYM